MRNTHTDILVIGAGASGLMAAITAAEENNKMLVTVLEASETPLKKLSATGNGRCNFTHEGICGDDFISDDSEKIVCLTEKYSTEVIVRRFAELGLVSVNKDGYYYPISGSAATVCSVLLQRAEELGIRIIPDAQNVRLKKEKLFSASFSHKKTDERITLTATAVILATGSRAGGFTKADPLSPAWDLKLPYKKPLSALTRIFCDDALLEKVACLRCNGEVSLYAGKKPVMTEKGEIQFVKEGLSGIAVFQLSGYVSRLLDDGVDDLSIHMNFLPDSVKEETVRYLLELQQRYPSRNAVAVLESLFPKKLAIAFVDVLSLDSDAPLESVQIQQLTGCCFDYVFPVIGTDSIKNSQVCTGGLYLKEFDEDFQSKSIPGLFACGEVLNADGPCGGYNLHFAWSSGMIAGKGATAYVKSSSDSL